MESEISKDILSQIYIRPLAAADSWDELTILLNTAYKKLLDQGFRYLATYQDAATTKRRAEKGRCFVAVHDNKMIGTVTYISPERASGCAWYDEPFVATFGQFGVLPELQCLGIGSRLIELVEELALKDGAKEIALDTSEGAKELIDFYTKRGYRFIVYAQWKDANYRSVILSKTLLF